MLGGAPALLSKLPEPPFTNPQTPGQETGQLPYLEILAASVPQQEGYRTVTPSLRVTNVRSGNPPKSRDSHTLLRKAPSFLLPKKKKKRKAFQPEGNRGGREIPGAGLAGRPTAEDLDRLKLRAQWLGAWVLGCHRPGTPSLHF